MYVPLRRFSSIDELAPVFEYGGKIIFVDIMVHPGCCMMKGRAPWEIILRASCADLDKQKDALLHEFVHLFHNSFCGYRCDPNETKIFNETEVSRQTKRLLKRNPQIVDEITRELILRPNCSVVFPPNHPRGNPFHDYYQGLVTDLARRGMQLRVFMAHLATRCAFFCYNTNMLYPYSQLNLYCLTASLA